MAYNKTIWEDKIVETPNKYKDQNNNVYEFEQVPGEVTKAGTPVDARRMNNIENGIYNNQRFTYNTTLTLENWVQSGEDYIYTINNTNITANHYVEVVPDFEGQKIMPSGSVDSYDGYFVIKVPELPENNVNVTIIYSLTSEEAST